MTIPHPQNGEADAEDTLKASVIHAKKNSAGATPTILDIYRGVQEFMDVGIVDVKDVRKSKQEFSITTTGFQYEWFIAPEGIDYLDEKSVADKLYPVLEQFVTQQLGASAVKVWNHLVRGPNQEFRNGKKLALGPVTLAHCDMTTEFAKVFTPKKFPDIITKDSKRWWVLNAWKPLKTVHRDPLAVAEGPSVKPEDLLAIIDPPQGPVPRSYILRKGTGSRWWYMKEQRPEELLLFLQYDSDGARPVPHTSVSLPSQPKEARESIELRLVVSF